MERKECMVCNYRKGDGGKTCPQCGSSHYCVRSERTEYDRMLFASPEFKYAHKHALEKGIDPEPIFNQIREFLGRESAILVKAMEPEYGRGTPLHEVEYTYTFGKVEGDWGGHLEKTSPSYLFFYRHREGRAKQRFDISPAFLVFHLLEKYPHGFEIFETNEVPKERRPNLKSWAPGRSKMAGAKSKARARQEEYRQMSARLAAKKAQEIEEEKKRAEARAKAQAEKQARIADARRRLEEALGESVAVFSDKEVLSLVADL